MMRVRDVMTSQVVFVQPDARFRRVAELMDVHSVNSLPVVDADVRVLGIVTESDLIAKAGRTDFWGAPTGGALHAAELMTSPPITVEPDVAVREVGRLFTLNDIKQAPVVESGYLVGIVTRGDVIRVFLRPEHELSRAVQAHVLAAHRLGDVTDVQVEIVDGVAELSGRAPTRSGAERLLSRVHRIDGLVAVRNRISFEVDDTVPVRT